ncbi:hypothetical protein DNU06_15100 [Putridiphycobacter roseus]|uniref:Proteinase inhibitor I42 chagasin domain-containing protein n=1 Tax=Putridiphycobacter roseus TaxID=2219161 RepID=A0A2W1NK01_9FLAO|nr:hypothetical protein [Putridiphycobacter roseus]PZE15972.1 hypothetical protein DNU06_15100 [Putridiphycobacter roseus]
MKQSFLFLLAILSIFTIACNKDKTVTACIEMDKTTINTGESITFTSCSENEWSYAWTIIGPDSAVENTMGWNDIYFVQKFDTPGSYQVKLVTYSDFSFLGESAKDSASFTVN